MKALHVVLLFLFCVDTLCWDLISSDISPITLSPDCCAQAEKCASLLRYTQCIQLDANTDKCNIKDNCIKKEYDFLAKLACEGEIFLKSVSSSLDSVCAKRLDSSACNLGLVNLNIFDYGNISEQRNLCKRVHESFTEKCIAGISLTQRQYYCTPDQYGSFMDSVCAVSGASQSNDLHHIFVLIRVVFMGSVVLALTRLGRAKP